MRILAIPFLAVLLMVNGSPFSATLRVPSQYAAIQAAIDAAGMGDTVLVADGTYEAPETGRFAWIEYRTNITITSENGREFTTLNGGNETQIGFWHSTDCTIEGFTLSNGAQALFVSVCSGIKIANCNISTSSFGTGVNVQSECGTIEVLNNSIHNNNVGVVAGGSGVFLSSNRVFENTDGVYCSATLAIIRANEICNNGQYGIRVDSPVEASVTIESNIIYGNLDTGLRFWASGNSPIRNNTISGNGFYGILVNGGSPDIRHNIIASNDGAGIAIELSGNPFISCNDVWGNSHFANGNYVGYITDQTGFNGNISADPYFCNASIGNYSLASNSPALLQGCGPMGAILIPGCSNQTAVHHVSWGAIKALYR